MTQNSQLLMKLKYEGRHSALQDVTEWLREINLEQYIDVKEKKKKENKKRERGRKKNRMKK